jgi:hypothetical protein
MVMNGLVAPRPILGRRETKTAHNGCKRRDYCLAGSVAMAHRATFPNRIRAAAISIRCFHAPNLLDPGQFKLVERKPSPALTVSRFDSPAKS